ncbi:MAG TPA: hypothetical protein PK141_00265 [Polyangiaceae bacterium]|nr:hypothetical protein [Polyangiaceae bacterium]
MRSLKYLIEMARTRNLPVHAEAGGVKLYAYKGQAFALMARSATRKESIAQHLATIFGGFEAASDGAREIVEAAGLDFDAWRRHAASWAPPAAEPEEDPKDVAAKAAAVAAAGGEDE